MQEQTAGRGPSLLTASPDGRPGPLAPEPDAGRAGLRPSPAEAPPRASLCSRKPLLPPGLARGLERPAVLLVGRAVPAGAGAPPVEAHAADPGALRRVRARGEAGGARPALRPAPLRGSLCWDRVHEGGHGSRSALGRIGKPHADTLGEAPAS